MNSISQINMLILLNYPDLQDCLQVFIDNEISYEEDDVGNDIVVKATDYIDIHKELPKTMPPVANELETAALLYNIRVVLRTED